MGTRSGGTPTRGLLGPHGVHNDPKAWAKEVTRLGGEVVAGVRPTEGEFHQFVRSRPPRRQQYQQGRLAASDAADQVQEALGEAREASLCLRQEWLLLRHPEVGRLSCCLDTGSEARRVTRPCARSASRLGSAALKK